MGAPAIIVAFICNPTQWVLSPLCYNRPSRRGAPESVTTFILKPTRLARSPLSHIPLHQTGAHFTRRSHGRERLGEPDHMLPATLPTARYAARSGLMQQVAHESSYQVEERNRVLKKKLGFEEGRGKTGNSIVILLLTKILRALCAFCG
jgi:hypothetical protein